ncbi:MAG TPA: multiheme c-type cytochrome [Chthoniobacterales bacterium]|jgi:hypothetical protein
MRRGLRDRFVFALFLSLANFDPASARSVQPNDARFVGAAGCQSSYCHGAGEKHSQYLTWVQQDFHARSYAVLVNARSARMAETLSLPLAQTSARCTVCHSPFQAMAPARLAPTAHPDEGVSCESCHGAAGTWLRGHTRKDWTYAIDVGAGMRDMRNLYVRANTCVACHQNLDADLLAAGHPELTFELDSQSVNEPKHWREDDPWNGPRSWLVGQAVALRETSWMLARSEALEPKTAAQWSALSWLLGKATANQPKLQVINAPGQNATRSEFALVQEQADLLARQAASVAWNSYRTKSMFQAIAAAGSAAPSPVASSDLLFRRASRLVLGLDRLSRSLPQQTNSATINTALETLRADARRQSEFQPAKFATDLAIFRGTITTMP